MPDYFTQEVYEAGDEEETHSYPCNTWTDREHRILLNQMKNAAADTLFPDQSLYRVILQQSSKFMAINRGREIEQFRECAAAYTNVGLNYEKLKKPVAIFNHKAPRSLMSLFHILLNSASETER